MQETNSENASEFGVVRVKKKQKFGFKLKLHASFHAFYAAFTTKFLSHFVTDSL